MALIGFGSLHAILETTNKSGSTIPQQQPYEHESKLLELPSELRNSIWEFALIQGRSIRISIGRSEVSTRSLLSTCRQIYGEYVAMYYSRNSFISESLEWYMSEDVIWWLTKLGKKKRALLRDLRISLPPPPQYLSKSGDTINEDDEKLVFLKECHDRLITEGIWMPQSILHVRVGVEYISYSELQAVLGRTELTEEELNPCERRELSSTRKKARVTRTRPYGRRIQGGRILGSGSSNRHDTSIPPKQSTTSLK